METEAKVKGNRAGQLSPRAWGDGPLWEVRTKGLQITREALAARTGISRASIEKAEREYRWPKALKSPQLLKLREAVCEAIDSMVQSGPVEEWILRSVREIGLEVVDGRAQSFEHRMRNYCLDFTDPENPSPEAKRAIDEAFKDFERLEVGMSSEDKNWRDAATGFIKLANRCGFIVVGDIFREAYKNTVRPFEETYDVNGIGRCFVRADGKPIDASYDCRSLVLRDLFTLDLNMEFYFCQIRYFGDKREKQIIYITIPRAKEKEFIAAAKARPRYQKYLD